MRIKKALKIPVFILPILIVLVIRCVRPFILVRIGGLKSNRIGHFAANTELYLCERDAKINIPNERYVDIFFLIEPICNQQLALMWKRVLRIWPSWILARVDRINKLLPGGEAHNALKNTTCFDIYNLLDHFPSHLVFTEEEELRGKKELQKLGIPLGSPFVCLIVRDDLYLKTHMPRDDFKYHNYRDSDIKNYIMAVENLAKRGYFVIRMGAKVKSTLGSTHEKIIDYATNGMRSDFMDVYLGKYCAFCISTGTGWDALPEMFRRPLVYVNFVPLGNIHTFRSEFLSITKTHVKTGTGKILTMQEIFDSDVGHSLNADDYTSRGIELVENTPEEICEAVIELEERLSGNWLVDHVDDDLQARFWELFKINVINNKKGNKLHGKIYARFGTAFLRNNPNWLQ